jgi:hypothetical protein
VFANSFSNLKYLASIDASCAGATSPSQAQSGTVFINSAACAFALPAAPSVGTTYVCPNLAFVCGIVAAPESQQILSGVGFVFPADTRLLPVQSGLSSASHDKPGKSLPDQCSSPTAYRHGPAAASQTVMIRVRAFALTCLRLFRESMHDFSLEHASILLAVHAYCALAPCLAFFAVTLGDSVAQFGDHATFTYTGSSWLAHDIVGGWVIT